MADKMNKNQNKNAENENRDRTERVELTVLCLITNGDKILLQNRVKNDWHGYALPGGHVESGESFTDACIREMKEETGLDVLSPRLVGVKQFPTDDGRYVVFLYKADRYSGALVSSDEGEMEWVERSRLAEFDTVNDLEELIRVMESPSLSEFIYVIDGGEWRAELK